MRDPADSTDYDAVRTDQAPTLANFIRWEKIKLREAAQDAIRLLESAATPTREYLDYMFTTDVGMNEIRTRFRKHQTRLAELQALESAATLEP